MFRLVFAKPTSSLGERTVATTNSSAPEKHVTQHAEIQLLSAERFAGLLDVSVRTLWRLRSAGKLPEPIRIGGSVRWRVTDIQAWMETGCPQMARR